MPRERIPGLQFDANVGWAGQSVQVGVTAQDGQTIEAALASAPGGSRDQFTGLWSDLDRAGVNRMIRALRKARDAAFGRDE